MPEWCRFCELYILVNFLSIKRYIVVRSRFCHDPLISLQLFSAKASKLILLFEVASKRFGWNNIVTAFYQLLVRSNHRTSLIQINKCQYLISTNANDHSFEDSFTKASLKKKCRNCFISFPFLLKGSKQNKYIPRSRVLSWNINAYLFIYFNHCMLFICSCWVLLWKMKYVFYSILY